MKLFPYAIIRVAGGPFRDITAMGSGKTAALLDRLDQCERQIRDTRERLVEALFTSIAKAEGDKQKRLLNIKRDVFNGRPISSQKAAFLRESLPGNEALEGYLSGLEERQSLQSEGESIFTEERREARQKLQKLAMSDALRRGLVLSSRTLLRAGERYANAKPKKLKKQYLKTELSLLKYLTRIHAKTSPFSTFTTLAMAQFDLSGKTDGTSLFSNTPSLEEPTGHIRLNNFLLRSLQNLLVCHPTYKTHLLVRPNPTLTREEECYLFLTNSNNVESFQRIPLNPALDLIWNTAAENKAGLPYGALVGHLGEAIEAEPEQLQAYIDQLLEYGFLEYNFEVSGLDPDWDLALLKVFEKWPETVPFLVNLRKVLEDLRLKAADYADQEVEGRIALLEEAHAAFRDVYNAIHQDAGLPEEERLEPEERRALLQKRQEEEQREKAEEEDSEENSENEDEPFRHQSSTQFSHTPEQMFYEDASLPQTYSLDGKSMTDFIETVESMYTELEVHRYERDERLRILHYFETFAKELPEESSAPILSFYEAYYRDHKKPLADFEAKQKQAKSEKKEKEEGGPEKASTENPFKVPAIDELQERRKAFAKELVNILGDQTEEKVTLHRDHLKQVNQTLEFKSSCLDQTSFALFIQPFEMPMTDGGTRLMGVLNAAPYGYGKMFSRFLHLFDPIFTATVRQTNLPKDQSTLRLEDHDASFFNANLHPPLMPYEIWMPGSQNTLPPDRQVPITDIHIRRSENSGELELRYRDRPLEVYDLGFQGGGGRSELFQLLSRFNDVRFYGATRVSDAIAPQREKDEKTAEQVVFLPRVVYEDRLVLRRKTWMFPLKTLPVRDPLETDWDYFRKVHQWRTHHQLPEHVFVNILRGRSFDNLDQEARERLGRDDYKPQYIHFRNPLLIRLFEKLAGKTPTTLTVSEMLPAPDDLIHIGGEPHVTEFVVQWESEGETE